MTDLRLSNVALGALAAIILILTSVRNVLTLVNPAWFVLNFYSEVILALFILALIYFTSREVWVKQVNSAIGFLLVVLAYQTSPVQTFFLDDRIVLIIALLLIVAVYARR